MGMNKRKTRGAYVTTATSRATGLSSLHPLMHSHLGLEGPDISGAENVFNVYSI